MPMPDRSSKRPRDVNELAAQIVGEAVGDDRPTILTPARTPLLSR